MALIQLGRDIAERDVEITLKRHDADIGVECMFDIDGSETFDPTDAVEVGGDGQLTSLQCGDELVMRVIVGPAKPENK